MIITHNDCLKSTITVIYPINLVLFLLAAKRVLAKRHSPFHLSLIEITHRTVKCIELKWSGIRFGRDFFNSK